MGWLDEVKEARKQGSFKDAMAILHRELDLRPTDAQVYYQIAWTNDALGTESEAAPAYGQALMLGLSGEDLHGAYLGLGSTYRSLGEYEKSAKVFAKARKEFPEDRALAVFESLTLYNLGDFEKAFGELLRQLAETSSDPGIQAYKKALEFYSDKLEQKFK